MLSAFAAVCLLSSAASDPVDGHLAVLKKAGRPADASVRARLLAIHEHGSLLRITSSSLGECLGRVASSDEAASTKLEAARKSLTAAAAVSISTGDSAEKLSKALTLWAERRTQLAASAFQARRGVAEVRFALERSDPDFKPSRTIRFISRDITGGVQVSAHGIVSEPGEVSRFTGQDSIALIASGTDPRWKRLLEFTETSSIQVFNDPGKNGYTELEFGTRDGALRSRWALERRAYAWSAQGGSGLRIEAQNLTLEGRQPIIGHFCKLALTQAIGTMTLKVTGAHDWMISSTRNGRTTKSPETHQISGTLTLEVSCL